MTSSLHIKDSVIFHHVQTISFDKQDYIATFVKDLTPLQKQGDNLIANGTRVFEILQNMQNELYFTEHLEMFDASLENAKHELGTLLQQMKDAKYEFASLMSISKQKRSILPFLGNLATSILGPIARNILGQRKLPKLQLILDTLPKIKSSQSRIWHMVKDNMSFMKLSWKNNNENSRSIQRITTLISELKQRIEEESFAKHVYERRWNYFGLFYKCIREFEKFKFDYTNYIHLINEVKIQLSTLTKNQLTPSVINPMDLKSLLLDIQNKISFSYQLIQNPETNLWFYYNSIICHTNIINDHIIISFHIPLVSKQRDFDLFQVFNLPIIYSGDINLTAYYKLESDAIAINKITSQYAFIDKGSLKHCTHVLQPQCVLQEPIYSLSNTPHCLPSLFTNNEKDIHQKCKFFVNFELTWPEPIYLFDNVWIISTRFNFNGIIMCKQQQFNTIVIEAPLFVIKLEIDCKFSSNYFQLPYHVINDTVKSMLSNDIIALPSRIPLSNIVRRIFNSRLVNHFKTIEREFSQNFANLPPKNFDNGQEHDDIRSIVALALTITQTIIITLVFVFFRIWQRRQLRAAPQTESNDNTPDLEKVKTDPETKFNPW